MVMSTRNGMESGKASLGHGTETHLPPLAIFAQMANQVPAFGGKCLTMFDSMIAIVGDCKTPCHESDAVCPMGMCPQFMYLI